MNAPVITKSAAQDLALGKNGSYSNEGNVLQDTLYDTLIAPMAVGTMTYFNVPIGQAGKTLTETNLTDPSKLPNGQTFLVKEFRIALLANVVGVDTDANTVLAAWYNVVQNSVFTIKIAGRDFEMRKPGSEFLHNAPVAGLASGANAMPTQGYFLSTGSTKLHATPIPFGQLVTFQVTQQIQSETAAITTILNTALTALNTQNAKFQIELKGILTRAI